jgi:hypothetical protein
MVTSLLAALAPFTGIFLWAGSSPSAAVYCQLANVRNAVSGDCYSSSIAPAKIGGTSYSQFTVRGETDGSRVILQLANGASWGTAVAHGNGFVLQAASVSGVTELQFNTATVEDANRAIARVKNGGATARASLDAERERANRLQTLSAYQRDYRDVISRYPSAMSEIERARADSVKSEAKVSQVKLRLQATRDSLAVEKVDWKRGSLQGSIGFAQGDLSAAQTGVRWASERIRDASRTAADMMSQIKRDSVYIQAHR